MGENLIRRYPCLFTKVFHLTPNVGSTHRFATSCYEYCTGRNLLLSGIAEQFLLQLSDDENRACFSFKRYNRFAALYRFYRDILQFADTNSRTAYRLDQQIQTFIAFFAWRCELTAYIPLWSVPFLRDSKSAVGA